MDSDGRFRSRILAAESATLVRSPDAPHHGRGFPEQYSFRYRKRANAKLKLAQDEVAHLAKVAERERIARDLHDVLGHTLSVIVLKSELAAKLFDRDSERAKTEILQVEQIGRDALSEVRKAIGGYRAASLGEEFARAKETLETAGVKAQCEVAGSKLAPVQEALLALAVREAVTNVVRHASASHCHVAAVRRCQRLASSHRRRWRGGACQEGERLAGHA